MLWNSWLPHDWPSFCFSGHTQQNQQNQNNHKCLVKRLCAIIPHWVSLHLDLWTSENNVLFPLLRTCLGTYFALSLRYKHWLKGLSLLMPKVSHFHLVWKVMAFRIRKTKTWGPSLSSMALGTVNLWLFLYGLKYSLHKKYMYLKRNNSLPCLKWYLTSLIYVIKE